MKKIIALLLTLVLTFSLCVPAFAADTTEEYDGDPIVVVRGIDFAGLVHGDGSKVISFKALDIFNLILSAVERGLKGEKDPLFNAVVEFGVDLFEPLACDKEGNPLHPDVHIPKFMTSADKIDLSGDQWADTAVGLFRSIANKFGGENTYLYTFDWRKSPEALAAELNEFIELVKTETGSQKVDIAACSMGGMITTAYLNYYGSDSIDTLTFLSSAHNGGDIVGAAFTGDLVIDGAALGNFLVEKTNGNFFVKFFKAIGLFKGLSKFLNTFISNYKDRLYDEFLRVSLGTAYGLWALVPDEYFDTAVDFFFDGCEDEYAVALEKIDDVKDFVCSTESILEEAVNDGLDIAYVSHYDSQQLPIYPGHKLHGDGVLESSRTSGFATFANYGATLSDEQIAGVDAQYISPDKVVNASTALYRDTTWIVKGAKHVGCKDGSEHTEFAIWLVTRDEPVTVYTNPAYPRFMNTDANENFIGF